MRTTLVADQWLSIWWLHVGPILLGMSIEFVDSIFRWLGFFSIIRHETVDYPWNSINNFWIIFVINEIQIDTSYLSNVLNSHSRSKHSCKRFKTRSPTKKFRNCRFFTFSMFSSLIHWSWAKFRTCVPQHILLSIPSIVITRISPTWSFGKPFVARVI